MQVTVSVDDGPVVLPSSIIVISKIAFFIYFIYSLFIFLLLYRKKIFISDDHALIIMFYFFQLVYALISISDIMRYLLLLLLFVTVPLSISYILKYNYLKITGWFNFLIYKIVIISILLNNKNLLVGDRFQGLIYNANLYGFICVFWLTILLLKPDLSFRKNYVKIIFIFIIFITLFLSGSRTSLVSAMILILVVYFKYLSKIILPIMITILIIYFLAIYFKLDFILERFLYSEDLVSDSGRSTYWNKAINYIKIEPWWGYGMDAPDNLVNSNIHNNYLRYLFSMGRIFTVITLIPLFIFICRLFLIWYQKIPKSLIGYFCAFIIANLGEDYFIGITATSTVFTLIIMGLIIYFMSVSKKII